MLLGIDLKTLNLASSFWPRPYDLITFEFYTCHLRFPHDIQDSLTLFIIFKPLSWHYLQALNVALFSSWSWPWSRHYFNFKVDILTCKLLSCHSSYLHNFKISSCHLKYPYDTGDFLMSFKLSSWNLNTLHIIQVILMTFYWFAHVIDIYLMPFNFFSWHLRLTHAFKISLQHLGMLFTSTTWIIRKCNIL